MQKRKLGKFLKKGSGEVIGFICTLPILLFLMALLVGIVQIGTLKERMEYATYMACRAAVVSDDYDAATANAQLIAEQNLASFAGIASEIKVELAVITEDSAGSSDPKASIPKGKTQKEKVWTKGNMCRCTLTLEVDSVTELLSGKKTCMLSMMIERDPKGLSEIFKDF